MIHIIDDDRGVLDALTESFRTHGHEVTLYRSAESFLDEAEWDRPGCVILDLVLPSMHGLDLLDRLPEDTPLRTIVLTGYGDVPSAVRAIKAGATDFIEKPIRFESLLEAVETALRSSREHAMLGPSIANARARLARLSPTELDVLEHLMAGYTTAETAQRMTRSPRTVGNHRQYILQKMEARNTAELIGVVAAVRAIDGADTLERLVASRSN